MQVDQALPYRGGDYLRVRFAGDPGDLFDRIVNRRIFDVQRHHWYLSALTEVAVNLVGVGPTVPAEDLEPRVTALEGQVRAHSQEIAAARELAASGQQRIAELIQQVLDARGGPAPA